MSDKVEILGSPLGMYSLLRTEKDKDGNDTGVNYVISVLKDDGALNSDKLKVLVSTIANMGANALRDFFWIDSQKALDTISPFDNSLAFNQRYFDIQREIATVCNEYKMRYYLSIFDHCGTKAPQGEWNPWRRFKNFFYEDDAKAHRHAFMDKILQAFDGLDTGIELCNEPEAGHPDFLADTFLYLHQRGFNKSKIIIGIDYYKKEKVGAYGDDYRKFREKVAETLEKQGDSNWETKIKSVCISPVHEASIDRIDDLWAGESKSEEPEPPKGGARRVLYSMDGVRENKNGIEKCRPDRALMYRITRKVLVQKERAREKGKLLFEVVYGKTDWTERDPLDSLKGVSEAYKDVFEKNYPINWGTPIYQGGGSGGGGGDEDERSSRFHRAQVEHGYRGILGRDADPDGLKGYTDFLDGGGTVLEFCRKLIASDEYRRNRANLPVIDRATTFYNGLLGRAPDPGGLQDTMGEIQNNRSAERAAGMLESDEFKNTFG